MGKNENKLLKIMMPMFKSIEEEISDVTGENLVADFIEAELGILFETENTIEDLDTVISLVTKGFIIEANRNPEFSVYKLLNFYEAFRKFYHAYQNKDEPPAPTRLDEDEET